MVKKIILTFVFALFSTAAFAKEARISMVYSNAVENGLPLSIFTGQKWTPDPEARFVKLHIYMDEPVKLSGIEIDTCDKAIDPGITIFFNFDQLLLKLDEHLDGEVPWGAKPVIKGNKLAYKDFKAPVETRSLTFNFEQNKNFSICGMKFFDVKSLPYTVKVPRIAGGSVKASSTLKPYEAYEAMNLFDSRFEFGWATDAASKGVILDFKFEKEERITKIRIWNGYQRSVKHCYANARLKRFLITGDNGYKETISVADKLGNQDIALPRPFVGRNLKMEVLDAYAGNRYKDLVVSEIRFFDGKEFFILDPLPKFKADINRNKEAFVKASLKGVLNDGFSGTIESEKEYLSSSLRLRADGSFYMSWYVEGDEDFGNYFALGNYEIKEVRPGKGINLRLFGLYNRSAEYGDCNGCGRDCNTDDDSDGNVQKIFHEFVWLVPAEDGSFVYTNGEPKKIMIKRMVFDR